MSEKQPLLSASSPTRAARRQLQQDHKQAVSRGKLRRIAGMGLLMLAYALGELAVSLKLISLTMFSDGLHNLSDALALLIAYIAERSKLRNRSEDMTYGWRRTETLGGLSNGLFLLSMSVFVILQAIPDFIKPTTNEKSRTEGLWFIAVAGAGIVFNVFGVLAFGMHGHSHGGGGGGGGDHGHAHGKSQHGHGHDRGSSHSDESSLRDRLLNRPHQDSDSTLGVLFVRNEGLEDPRLRSPPVRAPPAHRRSYSGANSLEASIGDAHGHSHQHHDEDLEEVGEEAHSHGRAHKDNHHGHAHEEDRHGHGHDHDRAHKDNHHGHSHEEDRHDHDHDHDHGHAHSAKHHGHAHEEEEEDHHDHGHAHDNHGRAHDDHGHAHDDHGHPHREPSATAVMLSVNGDDTGSSDGSVYHNGPPTPQKHGFRRTSAINGGGSGGSDHHDEHEAMDHNIWGLFLHFVGDVLTSALVLGVGLITYFFNAHKHHWVGYVDPTAACLSAIIIALSAWPVVDTCSRIFLQAKPPHIKTNKINREILAVNGVKEIHEQHFWQLVDGVPIASMHLLVLDTVPWPQIRSQIVNVLHRNGVHSSTLQPELISAGELNLQPVGACTTDGSCVEGCEAETCCPKPGSADHDIRKASIS